jgi:uncharacterized protein YdiU (UPF0061 family)
MKTFSYPASGIVYDKALALMFRLKEWYGEVVERSARLVALWQATGFVHGVLNTDNMSLIGLTIDYGPYGWMEE